MTLMSVIVAFLFAISLWYLSSNHKVTFVKLKATDLKFLPNRSWHRLIPAGGTFVSATGGTFQSDTPGTFVFAMGGTFDSDMPGTFESDTGGTFNPLLSSKSWDEPKELGKEKHEFKLKRHDACLYIDAILLKKDDVDQAIKSLDNRNLWGSVEVPSDDWQYLVNREKYWSPAYKDVYRNEKDWTDTIDGLNVPFIFSTEKACGHIEGDQSGTISKYSIPCRRLFEGLGMVYDA